MRPHMHIVRSAVLFLVCGLVAQSRGAQRFIIDFLDESSQSNVVVKLSDVDHPQPCPLQYTNVLSNTNLFTPLQQKLLRALPAEYRNITTNSGPSGTVLVEAAKVVFDVGDAPPGILLHFASTNSGAQQYIASCDSRQKYVKYEREPGSGYYALLDEDNVFAYQEFKGAKLNGLFTTFYQDHCSMWLCFTNGKALGRFLIWGRRGIEEPISFGLAVEAQFKEPYDFLKYQQMRFDLTWLDSPRVITNASAPAERSQPRR